MDKMQPVDYKSIVSSTLNRCLSVVKRHLISLSCTRSNMCRPICTVFDGLGPGCYAVGRKTKQSGMKCMVVLLPVLCGGAVAPASALCPPATPTPANVEKIILLHTCNHPSRYPSSPSLPWSPVYPFAPHTRPTPSIRETENGDWSKKWRQKNWGEIL